MPSLTNGANGFVKYGLQTLLRQGGALQVFNSSYVSSHGNALTVLNGLHPAGGCVVDGQWCSMISKY